MSLSDKIVRGGYIEDCACNSGDKDYHDELKDYETHFFIRDKYVKEAVRELKERIKDKNVHRVIDSIFGEKLI